MLSCELFPVTLSFTLFQLIFYDFSIVINYTFLVYIYVCALKALFMNVVHINIKYKYQEAMQGENLRKGTWLQEEDEQLTCFVTRLGERRWDSLAKVAGMFTWIIMPIFLNFFYSVF
jgi:hypothetical protein